MNSAKLAQVAIAVACASLVLKGTGAAGAQLPQMPMAIDETNSANHRRLQKPVLSSRLLDGVERTNAWSHHGQGEMVFTTARARHGTQAVRLSSPTKTDQPNKVTGRPFGEAVARLSFEGEDWSDSNRLSFHVYPHLPGFKVISMLVKLHNHGSTRVPDSYNREGLNFFLLEPDKWNHVIWEIAHLARDKVTAVEFIYRLQGNEPGATDVVCFDIDQVELQKVEADHFEGWNVAPGRIAYNHSGYMPGAVKTALATGLDAKEFSIISRERGEVALTEKIRVEKRRIGEFQLLDFTSVNQPGVYRIEAGGVQTPWFSIGNDAWRNSIIKTINHFYCQRCGTAVPGIHDICHADWRAIHGGKEMFINGGWHDAGDLSQGLVNSAEGAYAMFALAERLGKSDPALAGRLLEEARWGLDWVMKTRFGDGFRVTWATMDYWTDGVLGTPDDTLGQVRNSPLDNFVAASTLAIAARLLKTAEPELAAKCLNLAREDWQFAVAKLQSPNLELASVGALASMELFKTTGDRKHADQAVALARVIFNSQERQYRDWTVPLAGFFYTNPGRERLLHYAHRGHEQAPIVAMAELCAAFPDHQEWMQWYSVVALHSEYLKRIAQFTEPFGMLPASVYSLDESKDPRFLDQVRQGIKLDEKHYLRIFPVWFDFRGNLGTVLSQAKALSVAGLMRRDQGALELAQKQIEWTLGRNPFAQSLMYGEGHDYAPQYTAMSGNMAGMLPVGIQTREHHDLPYWPAANCYNYAEVWVHPSSRWLWIMADFMAPGKGQGADQEIDLSLTHETGGDGSVILRGKALGRGAHRLELRLSNLRADPGAVEVTLNPGEPQTVLWRAEVVNPKAPWVALVIADSDISKRKEVIGWH
jgi:hypothetical protein